MKVIITFIFCCDNLWRSKFMALEKPEKLREFFSPTLWPPCVTDWIHSHLTSAVCGCSSKHVAGLCMHFERVQMISFLLSPVSSYDCLDRNMNNSSPSVFAFWCPDGFQYWESCPLLDVLKPFFSDCSWSYCSRCRDQMRLYSLLCKISAWYESFLRV